MTRSIGVALLAGGLLTARAAAADKVGVVVSGGSAHLTFADLSGLQLDVKPFSAADEIVRARILFTASRGDISYVVLDLEGPTTKHGGGGFCGAGEEENLVWIKASHALVLDVRSVLIDSCTFSIGKGGAPAPTKDGLRLEYKSYSENRSFTCTYDARAPENGLTVTSRKKKD